MKETINVNGTNYTVDVSSYCITIHDSYKVKKREMDAIISKLSELYPENDAIKNRSAASLKNEWICHNLLYAMNIERERVKDVDLNYPLEPYAETAYNLLGSVAKLFIK